MENRNIQDVYIGDIEKYKQKCMLFKKLIKSTYPDITIKFIDSDNVDLCYIKINEQIQIAILPNVIWHDIKKNIDLKLSQINYGSTKSIVNDYCSQCNKQMSAKTSCNKCHGICCVECYIDNFRKNKGLIVCKFCDYVYGIKTPDEYIDILIDDIREKLLKL